MCPCPLTKLVNVLPSVSRITAFWGEILWLYGAHLSNPACSLHMRGGMGAKITEPGSLSAVPKNRKTQGPESFMVLLHQHPGISPILTSDFWPLELKWYWVLLNQHVCGAVLEQPLRTCVRREKEALLCGVARAVLFRWLLFWEPEQSHQLDLCRRRGSAFASTIACTFAELPKLWSRSVPVRGKKNPGVECLVA